MTTSALDQALAYGAKACEHRGRDALSTRSGAGFAIGHRLFDTGCNGLADDAHGNVLVLDGRIDNLDQVWLDQVWDTTRAPADIAEPSRPSAAPDEVRLLHILRRLGPEAFKLLRGDFAVAWWRAETREMVLARDQIGVRPVFFWQTGDAVLFASEVATIRAMAAALPGAGVPSPRSAAALARLGPQNFAAQERGDLTLWDGVLRVLPGHWLVAAEGGLAQQTYWQLNPGLPRNDAAMADKLARCMRQAVNRRLRSRLPIGALLSGGLDSSTIVSLIGARATVAEPSDVGLFSMVFPNRPEGDESPWIDAVADLYGMPVCRIDSSDVSALEDVDDINREQGEPPYAPNGATFRRMVHAIHSRSPARVILHGHGGDEAFSYGTGLIAELAENLHWLKLWREMAGFEGDWREKLLGFAKILRRWTLPRWRARLRHRLRPGDVKNLSPVSYTADGAIRPLEQVMHLGVLSSPGFGQALEVIDHEAAAAGVEMRMPFLDLDLLELAVTVPAEDKWQQGVTRVIQREAFRDVLPESVRTRIMKHNFGTKIWDSMVARDGPIIEETLSRHGHLLANPAELAQLQASWDAMRQGGEIDSQVALRIWRAVVTLRWLAGEGQKSGNMCAV